MIGQSREPGTGAVGSIGIGLSGGTPEEPITLSGLDGNLVAEEVFVETAPLFILIPDRLAGCLSEYVSVDICKTKGKMLDRKKGKKVNLKGRKEEEFNKPVFDLGVSSQPFETLKLTLQGVDPLANVTQEEVNLFEVAGTLT